MLSVPAGLFLWFPPIPLPAPLLPTGACRFVLRSEDYAGLFPFCQNSGRSGIGIFCDLACSKHPADVPFKKSSGHVRHIKCPHTLKTFLKSAMHFLNNPNVRSYIISTSAPQTVGQNGKRSHITSGGQPGAAGKARTAGAGKRWETVEMPAAKFTYGFS